jgi:hypothetical protein
MPGYGSVLTRTITSSSVWFEFGGTVVADGRSYRAGVERALFTLSAGSCYFPDCSTPVVVFVENHPVVNVEIAHIHGHAEGSARYDPTMDDENRRSFNNLVLLCHPHHKLVDRLEPDRFPASELLSWKHARESRGIDRDAMSQLTESKLSDLIETTSLRPGAHIATARTRTTTLRRIACLAAETHVEYGLNHLVFHAPGTPHKHVHHTTRNWRIN